MRAKYLIMVLLLISMLSIYGIVFAQWEEYTEEKPNTAPPENHPETESKKNEAPAPAADTKETVKPEPMTSDPSTAQNEVTPIPDFPLDVPLLNQMDPPRLYNGCEVTSMAMILNYFDIAVTKNELAEKVNRVPLVYSNGLRGNPNKGFVGDMEDGPGLSIYHGPLADATRSYVGDRLIDFTGSAPDKLFHYLDQGLPVWVIVTSTFGPVNSFRTWETPSGKIEVTFDLHSVVLTGYDKNNFYINNPYGLKNQKVNKEQFIKGWKQLGSQAIVITK